MPFVSLEHHVRNVGVTGSNPVCSTPRTELFGCAGAPFAHIGRNAIHLSGHVPVVARPHHLVDLRIPHCTILDR